MNYTQFLFENLDFLRFCLGVTYFLSTIFIYSIISKYSGNKYSYFIAFTIFFTLYYFAGIYEPISGDFDFLYFLRILFLWGGYTALIAASKRFFNWLGFHFFGLWLHVVIIIGFLFFYFLNQLSIEVAIIYFYTPTSFIFIFINLVIFASRQNSTTQIKALFIAVFLIIHGTLYIFTVPQNEGSSTFCFQKFNQIFGVPAEVFMLILMNIMFVILLFENRAIMRKQFNLPNFRNYAQFSLYGIFIFLIIISWFITYALDKRNQKELDKDFVNEARIMANAVNIDRVKNLTGTLSDTSNKDYIRIKEQLTLMRLANKDHRFIYLVTNRNDSTFFLLDSEAPSSIDYSPPGQYYAEAPAFFAQVFKQNKESVSGAIYDRWGVWKTAAIPLNSRDNFNDPVALAVDIPYDRWHEKAKLARMLPLSVASFIISIFILFIAYYTYRWYSSFKLELSEKRYRLLFENLRDPAFLVNSKNFIVETANIQAENLLNFSGKKITGLNFFELFPSSFKKDFNKINFDDKDFLKEIIETKICLPNAISINVEASFGKININDQDYIIAITHDITERKKTEKELKMARDRAELLFKTVPSAIFTIDKDKRITSWNENVSKITGYAANEVMGKECTLFAQSPCGNTCGLFDPNTIKPIINRPCTIKTKGGEIRHVLKNVALLTDNDGNVFGGIESFEDITNLKHKEEELLIAKKSAEKANMAKSEFLANMSHEIRTPIHGIIGLTDLLSNEEISLQQKDYLNNIKFSAQSLLEIINDMLDFAKIESGKMKVENKEIDIVSLIQNITKTFYSRIDLSVIDMDCRIQPEIPRIIMGDEFKIKQIVNNFLSNAIKFTKKGNIKIYLAQIGDWIAISVEDSGLGIKNEHLEMIFEKFHQADSSTARLFGGTGLGLSISKNMAELMGGRIEVSSEIGVGSKFTLFFPYIEVKKELQMPESEPAANLENIIIAAAVKRNVSSIEEVFEHLNVKITHCITSIETINLLKNDNPCDLIIIDESMIDSEGLGSVASIKKVAAEHGIRITLVLNHNFIQKFSKEIDFLKVDFIITKPVFKSNIFEIINKIKKSLDNPSGDPTSINLFKFNPNDKTILIAEDQPVNLMIIQTHLENFGFNVLVANNGAEAVDCYKNYNVDLIFMDLHMPKIDGYEATRLIRLSETSEKRTPIIALTADAMADTRIKTLEGGMDDYISKPFRLSDLFQTLEKHL